MGRKLLADPELPNKLAAGRAEEIRPCIYCYRCVSNIFVNKPVSCAVNPATGREVEFAMAPAVRPKHVLIAGGGPAGMEAARVAALRGHRVTLCEQSERLGGTAWFSSLVYEPNGKLVAYLEAQVRTLPIDVRLETTVTPELVRQLRPDVLLVAVGARRSPLPIPGSDRPNVLSGDDLRSLMTGSDARVAAEKLSLRQRAMLKMGTLLGLADRIALTRELTRHWMPLGKRVAIIGGGLVGVELAEFLSERDREVTVIEEASVLATEMALPRRWRALHTLREHGVRLLTDAAVEEITDAGVTYHRHGERDVASADHVIIASGVVENRDLGEALAGLGAEVHLVGDCKGVGYLEGAMLDAARSARAI
jgi:2,4-dienoyl-CoA reductase (NADPH2)